MKYSSEFVKLKKCVGKIMRSLLEADEFIGMAVIKQYLCFQSIEGSSNQFLSMI